MITLLGLSQVIAVKDSYLNWLLAVLIAQIVVAMTSLFKGSDIFKEQENTSEIKVINRNESSSIALSQNTSADSPPKKSTQKEEGKVLSELKQWKILESTDDNCLKLRELHRNYKFKTFETAFKFMTRATEEFITPQDHHPRWENTYNRLEIWLSTSEIGGQISNRDLKLAKCLEELWVTVGQAK